MKEIINNEPFNEEWAKEMKMYEETTKRVNKENSEHLKRFYNEELKLDID